MNLIVEKLSISSILLWISVILTITALLQKNSNFLDVRSIIIAHFEVFSGSLLQCVVIFGVPLLIAIVALNRQLLSRDIVDTLNVVLSILISMFFAMLSILSALNPKTISAERKNDVIAASKVDEYNLLLKETFNAIMFECILCILVLAISFALLFINSFSVSWQLTLTSGVVYYLSLVIIFNIFAIIKRIKILFDYRENC